MSWQKKGARRTITPHLSVGLNVLDRSDLAQRLEALVVRGTVLESPRRLSAEQVRVNGCFEMKLRFGQEKRRENSRLKPEYAIAGHSPQ